MGGAAVAGASLTRRCRRDLAHARAGLAAVDRRVASTASGDVEYAEWGRGEPLLVVHGIFHGCDGGLLSTGGLPQDRWLIAPSRFGYLGSPLPPGATPAQQADAFAALLDELAVDRVDVVGISAGTTSALQFALLHPDRVKHLVVISGNLPANPTAVAPPAWARVLYADLPLWAMKVFAPRAYLHLMGVPKDLPVTGEAAAFVDQMAESIFPMGQEPPVARSTPWCPTLTLTTIRSRRSPCRHCSSTRRTTRSRPTPPPSGRLVGSRVRGP
jgi:pimeloyl-ACP methyl ester carboxylesterase